MMTVLTSPGPAYLPIIYITRTLYTPIPLCDIAPKCDDTTAGILEKYAETVATDESPQ